MALLYRQLMEAVANRHAEDTLGRVAMLTAEEQHRILREWNATERVFDQAVCVPQLFELRRSHEPRRPCAGVRRAEWSYGAN